MSEAAAMIASVLVGIPAVVGSLYLITRKIQRCKIGCCECDQLASKTPRAVDSDIESVQKNSELVGAAMQQQQRKHSQQPEMMR